VGEPVGEVGIHARFTADSMTKRTSSAPTPSMLSRPINSNRTLALFKRIRGILPAIDDPLKHLGYVAQVPEEVFRHFLEFCGRVFLIPGHRLVLDIAFFPGRRLLGLSTVAILIAGGAAAASRQHQGSKEHQAKNQQSGK